MRHSHPLALLLALLALAACGEDQSPTAPTSAAEPGGPVYSHTPGHKVVNSVADPGDGTCNAAQCTLREAINDPQSTEITFKPGITGPITLASKAAGGGSLVIKKSLSITGPSPSIEIRRRTTDSVFRIFRITSGVSATLTNLTIRHGRAGPGGGGGILNFGTLRVTNCTVANNGFDGIRNESGTLTLTHSTIASNFRSGIFTINGPATLSHVRIIDNHGSGMEVSNTTVTITRSTIARNVTQGFGGGIFNSGGTVTIRNSTLVGNSAVAGGGISNQGTVSAIRLINSTVSGNSAEFGGGISNTGSLTFRNSTIAHNSASSQGGGVLQSSDTAFLLTNSLVAENSAPTGPDVFQSAGAIKARFSLIGNGSGSGITSTNGNQVGTGGAPIDPKLGPLADNGGPTQTHALLLGSPAIDAASTPDCPPTDQRGVLRPQGPACDIGSYERE